MTLTKDPSITLLVQWLRLDDRGWAIKDYWNADRCAIGITSTCNSKRLVYISTYKKEIGFFDYECETQNSQSSLGYDTLQSGENVPYEELEHVLVNHLDGQQC